MEAIKLDSIVLGRFHCSSVTDYAQKSSQTLPSTVLTFVCYFLHFLGCLGQATKMGF